jgi:hypothetical protein
MIKNGICYYCKRDAQYVGSFDDRKVYICAHCNPDAVQAFRSLCLELEQQYLNVEISKAVIN